MLAGKVYQQQKQKQTAQPIIKAMWNIFSLHTQIETEKRICKKWTI